MTERISHDEARKALEANDVMPASAYHLLVDYIDQQQAEESSDAPHGGAGGGDDDGYDMSGLDGGPTHRDVRNFLTAHGNRLGGTALASLLRYVDRAEASESANTVSDLRTSDLANDLLDIAEGKPIRARTPEGEKAKAEHERVVEELRLAYESATGCNVTNPNETVRVVARWLSASKRATVPHGDDRDRVSGGIVVPREGNPMLLCVKSYDSFLGVAYFKATTSDLRAAGYIPQEEHERVVAELRAELEVAWSDEHDPLSKENEALKAKLATERARADARVERLAEAASYVLTVHGYGSVDASPGSKQRAMYQLRAALSTAPQASTEQASPSRAVDGVKIDHSRVGGNSWVLGTCAGCGGTNAALFDGLYCCRICRRKHEEPVQPAPGGTERCDCGASHPRGYRCYECGADPTPAEPSGTGRNEFLELDPLALFDAALVRIDHLASEGETRDAFDSVIEALQLLRELHTKRADPTPAEPHGRPEQAGDRVDHASIGAGGGDECDNDCPPDARAITVYMSNDGSTLTFPGGAFPTIRACRHCGSLITGGPTACVHCVRLADRLESK